MEKFICVCGKEFPNQESLVKHQSVCKKCTELRNLFYEENKEEMIKLYENNSLRYVAEYFSEKYKKLGISGYVYTLILTRFKKDGIHIKTLKESNNLPSVRNKIVNFYIEHYGVTNASQIDFVKEKKRQKAQEVYGCDNVFQAEEIKEKLRNTMLEKYGTLHVDNKSDGRESKPHLKVLKYLKLHGYDCESEYRIQCHDENGKVIRTPRVDIYIPKLNLCVEVYGDWCHANPRKFEKEDEIRLWECRKYKRNLMAIEVWVKDEIRLNQIKNEGYNVSVIWEQDVNEDNFCSLSQDLDYLEKQLKENNLPRGWGWKTLNCIYEGNELCYKFDEDLDFVVA